MGIDYSVDLGVGFVVDREDVIAPFRKEMPEEFHMEDRFDPKTGKKLVPMKVIDVEADEMFEFEGTVMEEFELLDALSAKFDCLISNTGGYTDGEILFVTVDVPSTKEDGCEDGRFSVGSSALFDDVVKQKKALGKLRAGFKKLGIDLGEAKVFCAWSIS